MEDDLNILLLVFQPLDHCTLKKKTGCYFFILKDMTNHFPQPFHRLEWEKNRFIF